MPTLARIFEDLAAHWYDHDGKPQHTIIAKGSGEPRPTTLRDAKANGWLPSVTTILKILHKPALQSWLIEQAVLSVLTAKCEEGEELDSFVKRVLKQEKQQDAEAAKARDLGTRVHAAIEAGLTGEQGDRALDTYVVPVLKEVMGMGNVIATERVVVGEGYAGTVDCVVKTPTCITVLDFKTAKTLPKSSWDEHRLQLSAYAKAWGHTGPARIVTANIYISTTEPGKIMLCKNDDWLDSYEAFEHLVGVWQWMNSYTP